MPNNGIKRHGLPKPTPSAPVALGACIGACIYHYCLKVMLVAATVSQACCSKCLYRRSYLGLLSVLFNASLLSSLLFAVVNFEEGCHLPPQFPSWTTVPQHKNFLDSDWLALARPCRSLLVRQFDNHRLIECLRYSDMFLASIKGLTCRGGRHANRVQFLSLFALCREIHSRWC